MSEPEDVLLDGAFAAYRQTLLAAVDPAGPNAARGTVRRRRRRAAGLVAAATVLAVAAPVAGWAALGRGSRPPAPPAQTGSPTPSPSPTPTPTFSPAPSAAPSGTPAAPNGRISRTELLGTPVDLPAWPPVAPATCRTEPVRLLPASTRESRPALLDLRYGDVDRDGAAETVALIGCLFGDVVAKQLVVFDRDSAGQISTLGGVIRTHDGFDDITETAVRTDGTVRVRVADVQACCGDPVRRQWRGYRWDRGRFVQVEGPTVMPPPPTTSPPGPRVTLTAETLLYGARQADGWRVASMAVEIGATGAAVEYPLVSFPRNDRDEAYTELWEYCVAVIEGSTTTTCVTEPLAAGERRWTLFPFRSKADGPNGEGTIRLDVGADRNGTVVPGTGRSATFEVRFEN
ncbi:hypothetical protein EV384_0084 [Micromonospora kangleipakensis]|uniref:Uncharacterized protein n=1 Tax=Micromonospora kangleipakensis TaxID=1077942 RepID=A0A4Q8B477_9ACTN|nr:hypothetical protein [Micromonospora kangleipakensis]RZU71751.1 hypothetical protein EV384_0084 [Micromonospora kangleipakensis]